MSNRYKVIFLLIFLVGACIRTVDVWRPMDGSSPAAWREADVSAIARNYYTEGMNILYPRIDWRGNGQGFVESEFPIYPWSIALLYKIFGVHEAIGRLLSLVFSLITLALFFRLALYVTSITEAVFACLFFTLAPLSVEISTALQPEALMMMCYVWAAYAFLRWIKEQSLGYFVSAIIGTALAILAKPSAAHIGIFFALLLLSAKGKRAFLEPSTYVFVFFSLTPALLWTVHAHKFWLTYGNSLGISNEYHWIGADFFSNFKFIKNIFLVESKNVWTATGIPIALFGLISSRNRETKTYCIYWYIAIFIYYIVACRTTGDEWANYYHVISIPAFSLLFGLGVGATYQYVEHNFESKYFYMTVFFAAVLLIAYGFEKHSVSVMVMAPFAFGGIYFFVPTLNHAEARAKKNQNHLISFIISAFIGFIIFLTPVTFLLQARVVAEDFGENKLRGMYQCAQRFQKEMDDHSLILVEGGNCYDEDGYPTAYNASYFFYWLDLKGFNVCQEEASVASVKKFARLGAKYFIVEKKYIYNTELERDLEKEFELLDRCDQAYLFRIAANPAK